MFLIPDGQGLICPQVQHTLSAPRSLVGTRGANFSSFRAHESLSLTGETKPTGNLPLGKVVGGLLPPIPPASRVAFTTRSTGLAHQCTEVLGTPVHWLAFLAHQSF